MIQMSSVSSGSFSVKCFTPSFPGYHHYSLIYSFIAMAVLRFSCGHILLVQETTFLDKSQIHSDWANLVYVTNLDPRASDCQSFLHKGMHNPTHLSARGHSPKLTEICLSSLFQAYNPRPSWPHQQSGKEKRMEPNGQRGCSLPTASLLLDWRP
jgi:hypothetical protein